MNGAERVLVIILSSALAVAVLLAIAALIIFIKVLNHIKHIAKKAEDIANKAEAVGDFFQKAAGPMAVGRLFTNMAETVFSKRSRHNKAKENEDA